MKLSRIIPIVVIILIGLLVGAVIYIKDLRVEIAQLNQAITSLNESIVKVETERDNYAAELTTFRHHWNSPPPRRKRPEEYIREFESELAKNPQDPAAYYNLALIYDEHLDQPKKAIEYYQKYLELAPKDIPIRNNVKLWIENCRKRLEEGSGGGLYR